jgi:hypothetical protein
LRETGLTFNDLLIGTVRAALEGVGDPSQIGEPSDLESDFEKMAAEPGRQATRALRTNRGRSSSEN